MNEPDVPAPSTPPVEPQATPDRARIEGPPSPPRRFDALPLLYILGFLVLGGSLFYLYRHPAMPVGSVQEAARVDTLDQRIAALTTRLAALESKPAVAAPDTVPDMAPLAARLAALEQRTAPTTPDTGRIEARIAAIEARPAPVLPSPIDLAALGARIDGSAAKVGTLEGRVAASEAQVATVVKQMGAVTERSGRTARLQSAAAALATGQKLGDIPAAPPALARFATEAPPTDTTLRLSFNKYASAAADASLPAVTADKSFGDRLWARAQQSVTVRQGDRILLGDPIEGVIAKARTALDSGDLQGAVTALDGLAGPAAAAMAPWTGQARSLLEARAALAALAAG